MADGELFAAMHDVGLAEFVAKGLDKKHRITWDAIKTFLRTLCAPTLGSHYYLTLFRIVRHKTENLHTWVRNIAKVNESIREYGRGYENVCNRESMHAIKRGLGEKEREILVEHVQLKGRTADLPTVDSIAEKMDIDYFENFISDIPTEKLPKVVPAKTLAQQKQMVLVPWS